MEAIIFKKYIMLIIVFVLLAPVLSFSSENAKWQWVKAGKMYEMLKEGSSLWLIDVRGLRAYDAEHIESSVNIPAAVIMHKNISKTKPLVLVDDSIGQKTAIETADTLSKNGYGKIFVLDGGILVWEIEGYPVVKNKFFVRGVTTEELKWALSSKAQLKVFDMRDKKDTQKGKIQGSETVSGSNVEERIEKLKKLLKKEDNKNIADKLKKQQTIVLVYSASENAETCTEKLLHNVKGDIRYLIGGYEAFIRGKDKEIKTVGSCPTCPGK